ncbi:hypothetical protein [Thalassobacillus hwangdonensis]|uniref:DUF4362 domain-containing protein n=1 Tax=Thalassobacillus hwangdonensis TaxID=546108 RepID=A0ABW3L0T9_9BACI
MMKVLVVMGLMTLHDIPAISDDCIRQMEMRDEHFEEMVYEDVFQSYDYQGEDVMGYFTSDDLHKGLVLIGGRNQRIDSLNKYFEGESQGRRRLYFLKSKPDQAFLLYKNFDNENIRIELRRDKQTWKKVNESDRPGKEIKAESLACEENYHVEKIINDFFSN